jgi:hypothetical protein
MAQTSTKFILKAIQNATLEAKKNFKLCMKSILQKDLNSTTLVPETFVQNDCPIMFPRKHILPKVFKTWKFAKLKT